MVVTNKIGEVFRFFVVKLTVDEPFLDSSLVKKFQFSRINNKPTISPCCINTFLKSGYGYKQTKQLLDNVCDFKSDGIAEFFGTSLVSVYKDIIFYPGSFPISFLLSKDLDQHLLFILASTCDIKNLSFWYYNGM